MKPNGSTSCSKKGVERMGVQGSCWCSWVRFAGGVLMAECEVSGWELPSFLGFWSLRFTDFRPGWMRLLIKQVLYCVEEGCLIQELCCSLWVCGLMSFWPKMLVLHHCCKLNGHPSLLHLPSWRTWDEGLISLMEILLMELVYWLSLSQSFSYDGVWVFLWVDKLLLPVVWRLGWRRFFWWNLYAGWVSILLVLVKGLKLHNWPAVVLTQWFGSWQKKKGRWKERGTIPIFNYKWDGQFIHLM